jgi:hypothetical protein
MPAFRALSAGVGAMVFASGLAFGLSGTLDDSARTIRIAPRSAVQPAAVAAVTRDQVIARAKTWNPHTSSRIPYSQTSTYGGYRTDCSGYASMALALSKPGPNTVGLASSTYSTPISMSQLQMGDLIIDAIGSNTTRHAVIFEKWTGSAHSSYWAYEQRGGYGTDYRTLTYGLSSGSEFKAYRPKNLG